MNKDERIAELESELRKQKIFWGMARRYNFSEIFWRKHDPVKYNNWLLVL